MRYLPPPLPHGNIHFESLGRFIDNLMGDARVRRQVREKLDPITLRPEEMPPDPPPPVPPFVDDMEAEKPDRTRSGGMSR